MKLHTERLWLRPLELADAENMLHYRSDPIANQYQGWIPKTIEDVRGFIENRVARTIGMAGTWYQFVMIKKQGGELIGDIGVHFLAVDAQQVELGFTLDKRHQGQGYATEAVDEIINYLFNQLDKRRIVAAIDPRNGKSIELVTRLGFRNEARSRENAAQNVGLADDLFFALRKEEWRAGPGGSSI
jgi:RimJ/RimL family protein N-acetyltransferase